VDLHGEYLKKACAEIGQKTTMQVCDVNDWDKQVALFDHAKKTIRAISVLVCNAAVNPEVALLQTFGKKKHAQTCS
jgi:NAD(P)-dependent dehydrogenase (short-subunit alcohol dehydrogenase family)